MCPWIIPREKVWANHFDLKDGRQWIIKVNLQKMSQMDLNAHNEHQKKIIKFEAKITFQSKLYIHWFHEILWTHPIDKPLSKVL